MSSDPPAAESPANAPVNPRPPSRWIDLAASARLPNLPTVWSNVIAGWFLGTQLFKEGHRQWDTILVLLPAASLLYLFGTLGNDWTDHRWDARHKPHRAIPSGRMQRSLLGMLALLCLVGGLMLARLLPGYSFQVALILAGVITIYTAVHKIGPWAVAFMGLARFLLPIFALCACGFGHAELARFGERFDEHPLWISMAFFAHPLGLFLWTVGLSLAARREAETGHQIGPAPLILLGLASLLPLCLTWADRSLEFASLGVERLELDIVLQLAWTALPALLFIGFWIVMAWRHHRRLRTFVPRMLAGLCLVDLVAVAPFSGAMAVIILVLFLFAWALQRIAPAS